MSTPAFWVLSGPALPCGARPLGDDIMGSAPEGRVWLDVCILGQHLPQMYRQAEMHDLAPEQCPRLGLCPDCLGFGDLGSAEAIFGVARGVDEVPRPCPGCGGSGRPALRVTVARNANSVQGSIRSLPHQYMPPLEGGDPVMFAAFETPEDMCLACGNPEDGTGPRGEPLHPAAVPDS